MARVGAKAAKVGDREGCGEGGGREQLICFRARGSGMCSQLQPQRLLGNMYRIGWHITETLLCFVAWEFTVTEKNFPWFHISSSLKVKLLGQINTYYGHTFLLNSTGFTNHNINGLNFFQTLLPAVVEGLAG